MAWTTPRTWIAGELVTAALFNTHLRDNLNALPPATSTITTTGTVNQLSIPSGRGDLVVFANNATLLTINGIAPGLDGQRLTVFAVGAGQVNLAHQNGSAAAADRLINTVQASVTPLAATGRASYVYDTTTQRWRLDQHTQGATIAYTPTIESGSIGNGSISGGYHITARAVDFNIVFTYGSTTSLPGGGAPVRFSLPLTGGISALPVGDALVVDVAGTPGNYTFLALADANHVGFYNQDGFQSGAVVNSAPMTFAAGDTIYVWGRFIAA
jgi:hypothetical protein